MQRHKLLTDHQPQLNEVSCNLSNRITLLELDLLEMNSDGGKQDVGLEDHGPSKDTADKEPEVGENSPETYYATR